MWSPGQIFQIDTLCYLILLTIIFLGTNYVLILCNIDNLIQFFSHLKNKTYLTKFNGCDLLPICLVIMSKYVI